MDERTVPNDRNIPPLSPLRELSAGSIDLDGILQAEPKDEFDEHEDAYNDHLAERDAEAQRERLEEAYREDEWAQEQAELERARKSIRPAALEGPEDEKQLADCAYLLALCYIGDCCEAMYAAIDSACKAFRRATLPTENDAISQFKYVFSGAAFAMLGYGEELKERPEVVSIVEAVDLFVGLEEVEIGIARQLQAVSQVVGRLPSLEDLKQALKKPGLSGDRDFQISSCRQLRSTLEKKQWSDINERLGGKQATKEIFKTLWKARNSEALEADSLGDHQKSTNVSQSVPKHIGIIKKACGEGPFIVQKTRKKENEDATYGLVWSVEAYFEKLRTEDEQPNSG